ncbi:MAG: hypothetical protein GXP27_17320 [Planctomycetes bacterium]|nr:hypothetical protein [Planctomycetota bacterium]
MRNELADRRSTTAPAAGIVLGFACGLAGLLATSEAFAADAGKTAPRPPAFVQAADHPWDGGDQIDVVFGLSPDDTSAETGIEYLVLMCGEPDGDYREVGRVAADETARDRGEITLAVSIPETDRLEPFYFRVVAVGPRGQKSSPVQTTEPARARAQLISGNRVWMGIITLVISAAVVIFIAIARSGRPLKIRKIAGLEAVDEAVGRATEMGRPILFIPGIQDMNDIQTIAGITILARVAQTAAEYDARVEVPTCRSLVMTAARETVQAAYLSAGRPDAYNEDSIYYVTDEQFGYVAYLSGMMVRDKPAACFYMGAFFAESLILAETGNAIGAIQVAGTAMPAQLPFFVAACDYTLIGEEFFAASAYLSGDADQLGSLKGQDVGKLIVGALLLLGCLLTTLASPKISGEAAAWFQTLADYLTHTVLM